MLAHARAWLLVHGDSTEGRDFYDHITEVGSASDDIARWLLGTARRHYPDAGL
jgi:hypothetical protein